MKLHNIDFGLSNGPSSTRGSTAATPPETRMTTSTSDSSKHMARKPLAVAHLLAAYSAWARSCAQVRAERSSGSSTDKQRRNDHE